MSPFSAKDTLHISNIFPLTQGFVVLYLYIVIWVSFMNLVAVFLGGGVGSVLRYLLGLFFGKNINTVFPIATFLINILGSLFLGFVLGLFMAKTNVNTQFKLFLTVGIAGGFTTFSTFTVETFHLFKDGHNYLALIYPIASIILGFAAVLLGFYLSRTV